MKRWDFIPQPTKRDYEQNTKTVKRWLDEDYPDLKKRAKKEDAEIFGGMKPVAERLSTRAWLMSQREKHRLLGLAQKGRRLI